MVVAMRAEHTRYEVPGWGVGELWTDAGGVLLAHEIAFEPGAGPDELVRARPAVRARSPKGAASPPTGTLSGIPSRVGNGTATSVRRSSRASLQAGGSGRGRPAPASERHATAAERAAGPAAARVVELARAFLAGEDVSFDDVELDLSWATRFQHAVATTLRAVPRGEVVGYGELAALAGYPRAGRAAGTFCAHNRFQLVLPCHRVVGAGGIGGYGSTGVEVKRRLLALEGVRM